MSQITIIIPVYNAETTIDKTIKCLLNQSFQDFEILIVNDGSTDSSLSVISNIKDERIKVITQKNSGTVSAYVSGIKNAETKYLMFCDSDDFYKPDFVKDAYERITTEDVDFVNFRLDYVNDNLDVIKTSKYGINAGKYTKDQIQNIILPNLTFYSFKNGLAHIISVFRVTKICKRETLLKAINDFNTNIKQLEDNVFTTLILLNSSSIYMDERIEYAYVQQQISVSTGYKPNLFNEYETSILYLKKLFEKYSVIIDESQFTKLMIASTRVVLRRIAKGSKFNIFKNDFKDICKKSYIKDISLKEIDDKINLIFVILLKMRCSLVIYFILRRFF